MELPDCQGRGRPENQLSRQSRWVPPIKHRASSPAHQPKGWAATVALKTAVAAMVRGFLFGANMPFGQNCEFPDMDACIAALTEAGDVDEPAAACAALMRDTEAG